MTFVFHDHLPAIAAAASIVVSILVGLLTRRVLLGRLARLADATTTQADDALVDSLKGPLPIWFLLVGLHVALRFFPAAPQVESLLGKILLSAFILSATFWAADLSARLLQLVGAAPGSSAAPATGVIRYAMQIVVLSVGGLVLLSTLGISVTPVLTTLGIGGLAVALGLQETLANLFAGMQITLAGNIRVGDFIKLESGEEGYVEDIHWRATRVRTLPNNYVLIPNGRLAQSVFTNYCQPSKELAVTVQLGVHYGSDLDQVERVTLEVAREVLTRVVGGVSDFEPTVRYHRFGDSSIDLSVTLRAQERADEFVIKHEFIKALARRYAAEGIVIPYPIRAINMEQEKPSPPTSSSA